MKSLKSLKWLAAIALAALALAKGGVLDLNTLLKGGL